MSRVRVVTRIKARASARVKKSVKAGVGQGLKVGLPSQLVLSLGLGEKGVRAGPELHTYHIPNLTAYSSKCFCGFPYREAKREGPTGI